MDVEKLPAWLTPLPDAEAMRALDRWAIEDQGVPGLELMERAGTAVMLAVERLVADGRVGILCGKGNNGGDGLVVARLLRERSREVSVVCTADPSELQGDARANLERLPGPPPVRLDGSPWDGPDGEGTAAGALAGCSVLVDALLGTGFEGAPRGVVADAVAAINASGLPVVSVDVPSGVDASTGETTGEAVRASSTVTFHAGKPGLWVRPGKGHAGHVERADIGIPRGAPTAARAGLIEAGVLAGVPLRGEGSTKFTSGHVLVAGGSRGLTGAPTMTARAAMRAGAGYVTVCVPDSAQPLVAASGSPELMTRALPEQDGALTDAGVPLVLEALERGGALALGPGLGRAGGARGFALALAAQAAVPLVLDADGLNAHAGDLEALASRGAPTVLTPHAGELARLLEIESADVEAARLRHVRDAAARAGSVVVLKGADTLVAEPGGRVAISPGGSGALATAGTGDVLSGVLAALLAKGLDAFTAAAAAVLLHARAGEEAARRLGGPEAVIASDVIEALPAARAALAEEAREGAGDG